jgi:hypothetical protein
MRYTIVTGRARSQHSNETKGQLTAKFPDCTIAEVRSWAQRMNRTGAHNPTRTPSMSGTPHVAAYFLAKS